MKIGDRVLINGVIDEIRRDVVIIRNEGGYFGTIESEIAASVEELYNRAFEDGKKATIDALLDSIRCIQVQMREMVDSGDSAVDYAYRLFSDFRSAVEHALDDDEDVDTHADCYVADGEALEGEKG